MLNNGLSTILYNFLSTTTLTFIAWGDEILSLEIHRPKFFDRAFTLTVETFSASFIVFYKKIFFKLSADDITKVIVASSNACP